MKKKLPVAGKTFSLAGLTAKPTNCNQVLTRNKMKKAKLDLSKIIVTSFVTEDVKGGRKRTGPFRSHSAVCVCDSDDCETSVACDLTDDCPPIEKL